jgi:hypothetical protein
MPVYLCGARLVAYYPFGPTIGSAVNVTLMSYLDTCCVGVNADTGAIPDIGEFMVCLREGFREVLAAGGVDADVRLPLHEPTHSPAASKKGKGGEAPWR